MGTEITVPSGVLSKAVDAQLELALLEKERREQALDDSSSDDSLETTGKMGPKSFLNDPFMLLDQMGLNYRSVPSALTYETLRMMTEKNAIIAAIIQTRINQVYSACIRQRNKYSIGFTISHVDPSKRLSSGERATVEHITRFMENCGDSRPYGRDPFDLYVKKTVRERLTFDQTCSEVVNTYGGQPHEFIHVPADTIRIRRMPMRYGRPQTEKEWRELPRYVQVVDGVIVNDYTEDEMIFGISNPRADLRGNGYGWSELEMLIATITSHLWAEQWNQRIFSQGSTIKGIVNFAGKVPRDQLEAFRRQWLSQISGVNNAWRSPVTNVENMQWIPMQMSNLDMGYQQWMEYLIKVTCACYLIDPAEINFDVRGGVGQQPMFMTGNEAQQKVSKDRGLQPLLRHFSGLFTRNIVQRIDPNFMFEFKGLDAQSETQAIELRMKEAQTYKTLNEIRSGEDLDPVEHGDTVMNPVYIGYVQQLAAAEQQAQQAAAAPGQPGQPGAAQAGAPPAQLPPLPGAKEDKKDDDAGQEQQAPSHRSVEDWEFSLHASLKHDLEKALSVFDM